MARRRNEQARVLGPYANRGGFRVILVREDGTRESFFDATRVAAEERIQQLTQACKVGERTIRDAMKEYEVYLLEDKGNKANSVDQTLRKLRRFFPDVELALAALDPATCARYYESLRRSKRIPPRRANGTRAPATVPISVDYHRNTLAESKSFLKWCVKREWLASNPLVDVEGVGRRSHGKDQLRIDEARRWIARATELAEQGEPGAVAAMMTLLMGMRCSEIVSRVARDVDDDGRLLWIPDSKTAKGRRTLQVPDPLREMLLELCRGRGPTDLIFGAHDRGWPRLWVQRICREVGVKEVTAHGQRGLHSTLAVEAGVTARAVADALGHESFKTTARSYARPEAIGHARQARALQALVGVGARSEVQADLGANVGADTVCETKRSAFRYAGTDRRDPETPKGPASLRDP